MKKLYFTQTIITILLLITIFISMYYRYISKLNIFSLDFESILILVLLIASIMISLYSVYILTKVVNLISLPKTIYNSIIGGYYNFGFYYLFIIANLIVGIILIVLNVNKIFKKDAK